MRLHRLLLSLLFLCLPVAAWPAYAPFPAASTPTRILTTGQTTNSLSIKGSAGTVFTVVVVNTTDAIAYLKLYDTAAPPICYSSTVALTLPIPASSAGTAVIVPFPVGMAFTSGIGACLTAGGTDADNTPALAGIFVTILWS